MVTWIETDKAVELANSMGYGTFTQNSLRGWGRRYRVGRLVGGRWRFDKEALENFLGVGYERDGKRKERHGTAGGRQGRKTKTGDARKD